eukprot:TRINITY_DN2206_c3_g2_i1.p1 TRINITY_DN2206_c3_g2~~TRINITY_DN2206_c3_g2_i1.p1  ORF type:complete len:101 (+),score=11.09 TRINITY_DN2206_c3_g2_i1:48-350(+)
MSQSRQYHVDNGPGSLQAQGKPSLERIGGMVRNHKGEVLYMFSKHVGIKYSNEAEVLAILEALHIYGTSIHDNCNDPDPLSTRYCPLWLIGFQPNLATRF